MEVQKFKLSVREKKSGRGFTILPEAFFRKYLTCPRCGCCYEIKCPVCGMSADMEVGCEYCPFCEGNGQHTILPENHFDCPSCGLQCRSAEDLDSEYDFCGSIFSREAKRPLKQPPLPARETDKHCLVCDSSTNIERHHLDWNHENDDPQNIGYLCDYCHMRAHNLGKPLFDKLCARVRKDPSLRESIRQSATDWRKKNLSRRSQTEQP